MINPSTLDPFCLLSVALDDVDYLPEVPGVYFVFSGHSPVYVGSSSNIRRRWQNHDKFRAISRFKAVSIKWIDLTGLSASFIYQLEKRLIARFKPFLNGCCKESLESKAIRVPAPLVGLVEALIKQWSLTGKPEGRDEVNSITRSVIKEFLDAA